MLNWKDKYETARDSAEEIKDLKRQIKQLTKDIKFYDDRLSEVVCENDELKLEIEKLKEQTNGQGSKAHI
jgi:regulator of replication initiation timing